MTKKNKRGNYFNTYRKLDDYRLFAGEQHHPEKVTTIEIKSDEGKDGMVNIHTGNNVYTRLTLHIDKDDNTALFFLTYEGQLRKGAKKFENNLEEAKQEFFEIALHTFGKEVESELERIWITFQKSYEWKMDRVDKGKKIW